MKGTMRTVLLTLLVSAAFAQWGEDDPFNPDEKWCGAEETCYEVLNITSTAKRSAIKKRYRELSLTAHPDKFTVGSPEQKVAEEAFKKIARASEILTSNKKRRQYDKYLSMKKQMDSPRENPIVVLVLMIMVTFVIVHLWKTQLYEKDRKAIVSHKVIESYIIENSTSGASVKSKRKKSIKNRRKGKSSEEDEEFKYTDEQITAALKATDFFWPGWNGKPTYVQSGFATLWLPILFTQLTCTNIRWLIMYGILRSEYSDADCVYLCYTEHDLGTEGWAMLSNEEKIERLNKKDKPYNKKSLIQSLRPVEDAKQE